MSVEWLAGPVATLRQRLIGPIVGQAERINHATVWAKLESLHQRSRGSANSSAVSGPVVV